MKPNNFDEYVHETLKNGHQYFATDSDGNIWSYKHEPIPCSDGAWRINLSDCDIKTADRTRIGYIRPVSLINWKHSLVDINHKLTIIEIVNKTRKHDHTFCAIDSDGSAWSYNDIPAINIVAGNWDQIPEQSSYLGTISVDTNNNFNNWVHSLMNVNDILV